MLSEYFGCATKFYLHVLVKVIIFPKDLSKYLMVVWWAKHIEIR